MSKSDQNRAKTQAQDQIAKNTAQSDKAEATITDSLNTSKAVSSGMLPTITGGYSDIFNDSGFNNELTGKLDPGLAGTAGDTFTSLATTGGISPEEAQAMRSRASESARAAYGSASNQASRQAAATGGYGLSGSIMGNLARTGGQAAERATTDAEASIAGLRQGGKIAGASGLTGLAQAQNQAAVARTAMNAQQAAQRSSNRLGAMSGMSNLYGLSVNQQNALIGQMLQNYQQTGQMNAQDLSIYTSLANQPGVFDKVMGTITGLAGAAGGVMSGIGSMGPKTINNFG